MALSRETQARVVMAWLKGDADFTQCEGVCCVCGAPREESPWAGGAYDPEGRQRGICRICTRSEMKAGFFYSDDLIIDSHLKSIRRGQL